MLCGDLTPAIEYAYLMPLRAPVDANKPIDHVRGHDFSCFSEHEPPRRLPTPVLALKGANFLLGIRRGRPTGHMSTVGAQGTSATQVLPTDRPAWQL